MASGQKIQSAGPRAFQTRRTYLIVACVLAGVAVQSGCGGAQGPSYGSEDGRKIALLLSEVGDTTDAKRLASYFVKTAAPTKADYDRFTSHYFDLAGNPSVRGNTATAKVKIRHQGTGKDTGPVEWSFVKEGDTWKIKSAPLP